MPKSRHRKDQKKKSKARSQRVKAEKIAFHQKMMEEFKKEAEKSQEKQFGVEEVKDK
jgi:hypothetical protein